MLLGFLIAITDGFDGWLARRYGATRSGAFLDPLADKVLVLGRPVRWPPSACFPWLPVLLIAAREIGICLLPLLLGRGAGWPSRPDAVAKVKTVVQEFAIAFALVPPIDQNARWFPLLLLWVAVVLTLVTGAQYVLDGQRALGTGGTRDLMTRPDDPDARRGRRGTTMKGEVVAVGTELLLGQIVDTNSAWIGEHLALAGHRLPSPAQGRRQPRPHRRPAGREPRALRRGRRLRRPRPHPGRPHPGRHRRASPGCELVRDERIEARIRAMFGARGRDMPANNLRQADVPKGATTIAQQPGTAPGLVCPIGDKVVYAMPGVPSEMKEMLAGTVIPDLRRRSGDTSVIRQRVLRTWGQSESGVAEQLAGRIDALDASRQPDDRLPGLGHRGHQGAHHGQGRRRRRRPRRSSTRRRPIAGRPRRPGLRPRRRDDGGRRGRLLRERA